MPHQDDDTIDALERALRESPDNVPLLRHLADSLAGAERFDEAERYYRDALRLSSDDDDLRLALARCYVAHDKLDHAAVIVDLLVGRERPLAAALLLRSELALYEGELRKASAAYRRAIELDPGLANSEIAERLGPGAGEDAGDDLIEARIRLVAEDDEDDEDDGLGQVEVERPTITFADVGGMQDVKDEISIKVIQPLAHPELFKAYGKSVGGGVLMYGPPGCGKTHLARATAGEANVRFLSVGIHDVLDMWLGNSEKNLHTLFDRARRNAPCVLFFDEVDALAARRSDASKGARHVINQFLAELDGVQSSNEGVLVLAATNSPWYLDGAFRRPGRFDRVVFVPPPDAAARAAILRVLLAGKPVESFDVARLARKAEGFSGADLKGLVDVAIEEKLREALKRGAPTPLTEKGLSQAAKKVRPTIRDWFATARNHVLFANQGGVYDDVAEYMGL